MAGEDNSFKFYDIETLSFIKDLDKCVVLFDNDVSMVSWILRTIHVINPDSLVIIRTKVDQCGVDSKRTVEQERDLDTEKVEKLLGTAYKTYTISSHNIMRKKSDTYDWETVREMLT